VLLAVMVVTLMILMTLPTSSLLLSLENVVVVGAVTVRAVVMILKILMTLPTRSLLLTLENVGAVVAMAVAVGDHLCQAVDAVAEQPFTAMTCLLLPDCLVAEHPPV